MGWAVSPAPHIFTEEKKQMGKQFGKLRGGFDKIDIFIEAWMYKFGQLFLRYALAVIFIWFGALKPFGMSPAETLVERTVFWFDPGWFVPFLGWWEVAIGVCLLFHITVRLGILLLAIQLPGTFLPLALLPEICFTNFPFGLTLEGQYIIKNLLLISAALVVGGAVRRKSQTNRLV